jgi:hypothetical protein
MSPKSPLKPNDFPISTDKNKLVTDEGMEIADATSPPVAEDIAERLNEDAERREQDRWAL